MHFWRQDQFVSIRGVVAEAAKVPEWADYFAYCDLLEHGLRKQALVRLENFISALLTTPFEQRRRFVSWLYQRVWDTGWLNTFIPHPLNTRISEPTLREWVEREPDVAEPHCWLGTIDYLRRAVALDSHSDVICTRFIRCVLGGIDYATHELPLCYLGDDPLEDLADLAKADELLSRVRNADERVHFAARIIEERTLLNDYIRSLEASA